MAKEFNLGSIPNSMFQPRLPFANSDALIKCDDSSALVSSISNSTNCLSSSDINNSNRNFDESNYSNTNLNTNNNSHKMGSRRIFTPQFKLQVLESYRNDSDCKGNQRATARKYNIHRRQIQKWLQCESNLRSSVANIDHNSVKHQFHNVSHSHQQQAHHQQKQISLVQPQTDQRSSLPIISCSGSCNKGVNHPHSHHSSHTLNPLNVPSIPAFVSSSIATSAQNVLVANIAAAVAVAITSSSPSGTSTTTVSPLRPTPIAGKIIDSLPVSTISPSILHSYHRHHHHSPWTPYARSPVAAPATGTPVSVPMLPLHVVPLTQPHAMQHQHYQCHNLSSHIHAHTLPPLSHQSTAFLPTSCLPVNVLSAATTASPPANIAMPSEGKGKESEAICTESNVSVEIELCERNNDTNTSITATSITTPPPVMMDAFARRYMYESERKYLQRASMHGNIENMHKDNWKNAFESLLRQNETNNPAITLVTVPMDLSLRSREKDCSEINTVREERGSIMMENSTLSENTTDCGSLHKRTNQNDETFQGVDLTFRKRKIRCFSINDIENPVKCAKRFEYDSIETEVVKDDNFNEDNHVEFEVEVNAQLLSSKSVKLFRPYLLDDNNDSSSTSKKNESNSSLHIVIKEQREPVAWSNCPAFTYEGSLGSTPSPRAEKHPFLNACPNFTSSKELSPQSAMKSTSAPSISPASISLSCPKGSPVSGYESSSSVGSERDDYCNFTGNDPYSIELQMHACAEKLSSVHTPSEWLDQEKKVKLNTLPISKASIAFYA